MEKIVNGTGEVHARAGKNHLERTVFETSRAAEYFSVRELQAQTGQAEERLFAVLLKELVDNGLDAAETQGVAPQIRIGVHRKAKAVRLMVQDNGGGIPEDTVRRVLNFNTRTSDKAAYRAPTRGAQGNALKTVLGIPFALGSQAPIIIQAQGIRHSIRAWTDPAGELRIKHNPQPVAPRAGTRIMISLPTRRQELKPGHWARAFALFNPHGSVKIRLVDGLSKQAKNHEHDFSKRVMNDDYTSRPATIRFPDSV
jgi:DNA topoisomerase VI subunit B